MKFSIIKHNKHGSYTESFDGYINAHWFGELKRHLTYTPNHEDADFSIFPIVWEPDYEYDTRLNRVNFNNIVVLDFTEFGCGTWPDIRYTTEFNSLFGVRFTPYDGLFEREPQFRVLHENMGGALRDKIRLYFKRELPIKINVCDLDIPILPADFINTYDGYTPSTEDQFWDRGMDLLYIWGRSSQDRVRLHSSIFGQMDRFGHNMYTSEKQYDEELIKNGRDNAISLFHKEWYERCDFMKYQSNSRCVIDLYGAGMKCFRTIESTINAVSFKQDMTVLSHAYPWIDGENCIMFANKQGSNTLDVSAACDTLWHYIRGEGKQDLYQIYLKSCEINLKYRNVNYIPQYVIPNIKSNLI
jgi:hypothetical protein